MYKYVSLQTASRRTHLAYQNNKKHILFHHLSSKYKPFCKHYKNKLSHRLIVSMRIFQNYLY